MKKRYSLLLACIFGMFVFVSAQTKIKVACIGNSITAGATPALNYPNYLQTYLGTSNYKVYNFGRSSTTLRFSQALAWIKQTDLVDSLKKVKPDIVVIKLGTNDAGAGSGIAAEYTADYLKLVDSVKSWSAATVKIYLCYPIPIFSNPTSDGVVTNTIIPAIDDVATQKSLKIIDPNTYFTGHSELCVADGIHPSTAGFQAIARIVFDSIKILVTKITVSVSGGGSPIITTNGGKLQMVATVEPADATTPYVSWSIVKIDDNAIITGLGSVTAKGNGTVKAVATATDTSGIKGELLITISNQSAIDDYSMDKIEIFPNPAKDHLTVTGLIKGATVEVFDVPGTKISETTAQGNAITLDLSEIKAGVYFVKITVGEELKTLKFIKE